MPNTAIENGNQAVIGIGRRSWIEGSTRRATSRFQPMNSPSGIPMAAAIPNPSVTRRVECSTLATQVPEYGDSDRVGAPKIQRYHDCATCAGDGMMPSATHRAWTATVHTARKPSGSRMNQGTRRELTRRSQFGVRAGASTDGLLSLAQLRGRLLGRPTEEIVGVVLRDLPRHVPRDDAVVGEEAADPLDRLERQRPVQARDPDRLGGDRLGETGLLRVDARPLLRIGLGVLEDIDVRDDQQLDGFPVLFHEAAVDGEHGDEPAHGLGVVVVDGWVLGVAVDDTLGAERLPHHGHVDLLALQRLEIVGAAAHHVDDLELAVVEPVFLRGGRELQPRDGARSDPDGLLRQRLPLLDVVTLAYD